MGFYNFGGSSKKSKSKSKGNKYTVTPQGSTRATESDDFDSAIEILVVLNETKKPMTISEISDKAYVREDMVLPLINKLIKKGYIQKVDTASIYKDITLSPVNPFDQYKGSV